MSVSLKLIRVDKAKSCTRGVLLLNGRYLCVTLERPWQNNATNVSCIPVGAYTCKRVQSPKFGDTFEVTGVDGRTHILFHAGNSAADTSGCILLGTSMQPLLSSISQSKKAVKTFMAYTQDVNEFKIEITEAV